MSLTIDRHLLTVVSLPGDYDKLRALAAIYIDRYGFALDLTKSPVLQFQQGS